MSPKMDPPATENEPELKDVSFGPIGNHPNHLERIPIVEQSLMYMNQVSINMLYIADQMKRISETMACPPSTSELV